MTGTRIVQILLYVVIRQHPVRQRLSRYRYLRAFSVQFALSKSKLKKLKFKLFLLIQLRFIVKPRIQSSSIYVIT